MDAQALKVCALLCGSPRTITLSALNRTPKSFLDSFPSSFRAEGLLGPGNEILIQVDRRPAHHAYILLEQYVHQAACAFGGVAVARVRSVAKDEVLELQWHLRSVAMLRAPGRLRAVGEAIDSDSDLRPTIAARSFPPKRRLKGTFTDYAEALETRLNPAEAEGCFFERDTTPRGYGDLLLVDDGRLRINRIHEANGLIQDVDWCRTDEHLQRVSDYLARIADAMNAFHGYCVLNLIDAQRIRFLKRNAVTWLGRLTGVGRVLEDPAREVSDVYWWNYFGPSFVERWAGRIDSLGVKHVKTAAGGVVIWATDSPFVYDPKIKKLGDYSWKHPFYDVLGGDVFMWEGQKQREPGEAVPNWDDHHRAARVDVSSLAGAEPRSMKGRVLPRVVVLKQPAPPEEPDG